MGYDSTPGHGMHQKQPSPGLMQQQNSHHFQGHGQNQMNGEMPGSHQPPVTAPPNVTLTAGQYWKQNQQQHQQPQHYGMVPNGMPYYQPQHPPLPTQPTAQPQAQIMPPTSQNFTPPRGSPQHHHMGRGGTDSPLPVGVSSVPMMTPSTLTESGSPQSQTRERSPHGGSVGLPAAMQGGRYSHICTAFICSPNTHFL
ncbi:hypothetical protein UPYG_G00013390 [Umbra pygmaea]|uniref:Uncharacterized protein n=1 Tax=Umbra pygmaea TaxID=75934 RepID=A0ABD0XLF7_UMBPY